MARWLRTLRKRVKLENTGRQSAFPSTRETWWLVDPASELNLPWWAKVMPPWYYTWSHDLAAPISGNYKQTHITNGVLHPQGVGRKAFASPMTNACTVIKIKKGLGVNGVSGDIQGDCISNISNILIITASFDVSLSQSLPCQKQSLTMFTNSWDTIRVTTIRI